MVVRSRMSSGVAGLRGEVEAGQGRRAKALATDHILVNAVARAARAERLAAQPPVTPRDGVV